MIFSLRFHKLWTVSCCLVIAASALQSDAYGQSKNLKNLARRVEPSLVGSSERVPQYIEAYQTEFGNDSRLFYFEVNATVLANDSIQLNGYVEFPEMKRGLVEFLQLLGFEVVDEIESLPTDRFKDKSLGILKSSHAYSYDSPSDGRSVVTDCLLGDRLYLLREVDGHYLVHSQEGYLGYVSKEAVLRSDQDEIGHYFSGPGVRILAEQTTEAGFLLPQGARLKWIDTEGETVKAELPTGEIVSIPSSKCAVRDRPLDSIDEIIKNSYRLLGTEYVWGGKTCEGIDCSGLVQIAFYSKGLNLPRDSNQQFLLGTLTGTRWERAGIQRGDTLYFLGPHGRIRHTAIYLGEDRYIQAETPVVNIRSLNPKHDDFDPRRAKSFAFAKRLLD